MSEKYNFIEEKDLSLSEWLELVYDPPSDKTIIDYKFPTDEHLEEYIDSITDYTENEIHQLLMAFLIPSTSLGADKHRLDFLRHMMKNPEKNEFDSQKILSLQSSKRLLYYAAGRKEIPPWEGITWILDLLPNFPKQAIEALSAYILAHAQQLPDGRFQGLSDALEIIRARYIGTPSSNVEKKNVLFGLSPRDFEHIIERLYAAMGYTTTLTAEQKDGGRDIIAFRESPGQKEHLRIECKLYNKNVGVKYLRALLGVVSDEKVNKGVIVTSSNFTGPTKEFAERNPKLELINGADLVSLLNKFKGAKWSVRIDRIIVESKRAMTENKDTT